MSKKIFFRVVGGIGNQLFIYFTGKALEKKGYEVIFDLNSGFFWDEHQRESVLQKLDSNIRKSNWLEIFYLFIVKYFTSPLIGFFLKEKNPNKFTNLNLLDNRYNFIEGYFQSFTYFDHHKKEIINGLNFDIIDDNEYLNYLTIIQESESVCIHIRTVQKTEHTSLEEKKELLDIDYYNNSITKMINKIGENSIFFVFARDLIWAKNNLPKGFKYVFVEQKVTNDLYEFILMSKCKNFILANSTFSWWAAYISGSKNVIYKEQVNQLIGIKDNYFPDNWSKYSK